MIDAPFRHTIAVSPQPDYGETAILLEEN